MNEILRRRRLIFASTAGNILEWYDFISFGFMLNIISNHFFPSSSPTSALLMSAGTFGAAYVMRPIGGVIFGIYADRHGRKSALLWVIALMSLSTAMIGFSPTYQSIGVVASVLLVVARLLQGASAGGEFGSATSLLIESAPAEKRGLYGSFQLFSQYAAGFLAAVTGALITLALTPAQLDAWGWRVPFLFGLLIGPVGLYVRRKIDEPEEFKVASRTAGKRSAAAILWSVLRAHPRELLVTTGLVGGMAILQFVFGVFMPTFATRYLKLSPQIPFIIISITAILRMIVCPAFGALSDRLGRKPVMAWGYALMLVSVYPLFVWVVHAPSFFTLFTAEIVFSILSAMCLGPVSTTVAEIFPTEIRSTSVSVSYNVASTVFGGFTPFIITLLIQRTGDLLSIAYYVTFGVVLGLVSTLFLPPMSSGIRSGTTSASPRIG
ncbi:MFS transporter [Burkholderia sp. AU30198]|uniref:MFS transporter n=1 Tax=Burkholderia sp. AU30198 TaxID=2879627 RepID=UPI001CF323C0|nr:MFS transporter [Burkholderia sp. AU30198]MCA8299231.1 MFS transporter [Burkholderia sp. AU30198]